MQTKGFQATSQDMCGASGRFVDVEIGFRMQAYVWFRQGKQGFSLHTVSFSLTGSEPGSQRYARGSRASGHFD